MEQRGSTERKKDMGKKQMENETKKGKQERI